MKLHARRSTGLFTMLVAAGVGSTARCDIIEVAPGESIQAAIEIAVDGDTVQVAAGTYIEQIDFLGKAITVRGTATGGTVIDGGGDGGAGGVGPVVSFVSGEGPQSVLLNVTVRGGTTEFLGGGMLIHESSPLVRFCDFTDNHAQTGGAVACLSGGGVIDRCTFDANSATYDGGALFNATGLELSVLECIFTANSAGNSGGAVAHDAPVGRYEDCTFSANFAVIEGGAFDSSGGAILDACTFDGNVAGLSGGGISDIRFTFTNVALVLTDCAFDGNSAGVSGGGVAFADLFDKIDPSGAVEHALTGCVFRWNTAPEGGAMYNHRKSPTATDCEFMFNGAPNGSGGAVANVTFSQPRFDDCAFRFNIADQDGGAMFNEFSDPVVTGCDFTHNEAGMSGGAMHFSASDGEIEACRFEANTATWWGGAIFVHLESRPVFRNCEFVENSANAGGAIAGQGPPEADGGDVAGVIVIDTLFQANVAATHGGAMYDTFSTPGITHCVFRDNVAERGGALWGEVSGPDVVNSLFVGNVGLLHGGAMYNLASNAEVINCTFVENVAAESGGAIHTSSGGTSVRNSVLWGNAPDQVESGITVSYSVIQNGWPGEGNHGLDPLLDELHRPSPTSPAIDSGNNEAPPLWLLFDLAGSARFHDDPGVPDTGVPSGGNPVIDMGAYEFQGTSPVVCDEDLNDDGAVDFSDLLQMLAAWGICGGCDEDLNHDNVVGFSDLLQLLGAWGPCS